MKNEIILQTNNRQVSVTSISLKESLNDEEVNIIFFNVKKYIQLNEEQKTEEE